MAWDTSSILLIDIETAEISQKIEHPHGSVRCWGLQLINDSKVLCRDSEGIVLIDIEKMTV